MHMIPSVTFVDYCHQKRLTSYWRVEWPDGFHVSVLARTAEQAAERAPAIRKQREQLIHDRHLSLTVCVNGVKRVETIPGSFPARTYMPIDLAHDPLIPGPGSLDHVIVSTFSTPALRRSEGIGDDRHGD